MLPCPVRYEWKTGTKPFRNQVIVVTDVKRPVPDMSVTSDLGQHLGVVVRGQPGLPRPCRAVHRQPAQKVGHEYIGRSLQLGVLVQVMVNLPGFITDPQVVWHLPHNVKKDREVGQQDLVHLPEGLEAMQLVLTG